MLMNILISVGVPVLGTPTPLSITREHHLTLQNLRWKRWSSWNLFQRSSLWGDLASKFYAMSG